MELLSNIWDGIVTVYTFPIVVWNGGLYSRYHVPDISDKILGGVLMLFIWGITLLILIGLYAWVRWLATTKQCQHCRTRTKLVSTAKYPFCQADLACCHDCLVYHQAKRLADTEAKVQCPIDDVIMEKKIYNGCVVVNVCPTCSAEFLPHGRLARLQQISYDSGHESGHSSGFATGTLL